MTVATPEKERKPVRKGSLDGERRDLLLVRRAISPSPSGLRQAMELSDAEGEGSSTVGTPGETIILFSDCA